MTSKADEIIEKIKEEINRSDLIMEYFRKNLNQNIQHPGIVGWVVQEYKKRTGKVFRDPDRAIRKLSQQGQLIKIAKEVYKYDPNFINNRELEDFSPQQKAEIFKRDNFRCVICGRGKAEGIDIHADHIKPKEFGEKLKLKTAKRFVLNITFRKNIISRLKLERECSLGFSI